MAIARVKCSNTFDAWVWEKEKNQPRIVDAPPTAHMRNEWAFVVKHLQKCHGCRGHRWGVFCAARARKLGYIW